MTAAAFEQLLAAAESHLSGSDLQAAEQACKRALTERPNDQRALMLGAGIAARSGNYDRAEYLLGRLLSRTPANANALYLLGRVHWHAGQPRKALTFLCRGLQVDLGLGTTDPAESWWRIMQGVAAAAPIPAWYPRLSELSAVGTALERCGELASNRVRLHALLTSVDPAQMPDAEAVARLRTLAALAGFSREAAPDWNRELFESIVLPWLRRSLDCGHYDAALMLERVVLDEYVTPTETEAHFASAIGQWSAEMARAGAKHGARLPSLGRGEASVPVVAFFVHRLSTLAHVRLMLDLLEGHAALQQPLMRPFVACFETSRDPQLADRLRKLAVEVAEVPALAADYISADDFVSLRKTLSDRAARAVVWVSRVEAMSFAFGLRIAPVQIWWAMKYHSLELDRIDGYLASGSISGGKRRLGNREWRIGPIAAKDWFDPGRTEDAARERRRLGGHRLLYGCFGREEKLVDPAFLKAVAAVLRAVPDAGFLWTGRQRHPAVQAMLESEGVAARCHFIGWVDTRLYAQVIDVFLDSFPFPCAYTLYEAMAAGKPAVLYASPESAETGARSLIEPLLAGRDGTESDRNLAQSLLRPSGEDLFLLAADPHEYAALGARLGADEPFRRRAGDAARGFVEHFMTDRARFARIYSEHIAAIARESAG